jgi:ABC-type lipoprotein release transport system permease subunit
MAVFTRSFQEGTYAKMIDNAIGAYTGYIQVHQKDFWDDKSLDNGLELNEALSNTLSSVKGVSSIENRLESFALASYGNNTKGALILGLEQQNNLKLDEKIVEGQLFDAENASIVLSQGLAKYLKLGLNDTLVLIGQGRWGQSAVGAFPICGIVKLPAPDLNNQAVFMNLKTAQNLFSFPNGASSIIVNIDQPSEDELIKNQINAKVDTSMYKAMTWTEMTPELMQLIEGDKAGGIAMIGILYLIIAFGVFGTTLMMTEERKKELAVMVAIGTQKTKLMVISFYETLMINSLAVVFGIIFTIPILYYFNVNPIQMTGEMADSVEKLGIEPVMPTLIESSLFIEQILIIIFIVLAASLYPLFSIFKMNVIKSIRK